MITFSFSIEDVKHAWEHKQGWLSKKWEEFCNVQAAFDLDVCENGFERFKAWLISGKEEDAWS